MSSKNFINYEVIKLNNTKILVKMVYNIDF
ncbi:hypothetical protein HDF26_004101 [Pedobacter cryoconitis]|uniref:Uncharacterized protein n=1 Tax=Pedobacter cryoconitis TaxID=188932 RepID=A0A7W9DXU3_9SPHI|nr:hypothetical protein [Pedobacter cryoconitis]MBB6273641.1 hypothetical protein [Pedobacter cryoconitis]